MLIRRLRDGRKRGRVDHPVRINAKINIFNQGF